MIMITKKTSVRWLKSLQTLCRKICFHSHLKQGEILNWSSPVSLHNTKGYFFSSVKAAPTTYLAIKCIYNRFSQINCLIFDILDLSFHRVFTALQGKTLKSGQLVVR